MFKTVDDIQLFIFRKVVYIMQYPAGTNISFRINLSCQASRSWSLLARHDFWLTPSNIYKYDIPVGCPPGITSPREDCRSPEGDNPLEGKLFLVDTPQGCHICFIIPNKIQKGGNYKHQGFWINTRRLPCWTSFTGRSLGKLCWCLWVFFGLAVTNQIAHGCCHGLFKYPMATAMGYLNSP